MPEQTGPKTGGLLSLSVGAAGSSSNTESPGPSPISVPSGILIHPAVCQNRHGQKSEGCCAPFRGGAGSPFNTMWPGQRPTSVPSDILIHPTLWPQHTNVTDRQTDNGPIAQGEPFYKRLPKTGSRDPDHSRVGASLLLQG